MDIQQEEGSRHSRFYVEEDGNTVAEIVYSNTGKGVITIEHTEVDEKLQGQNVGLELVRKVVEHARANGLKIIPACSFAKAVFDRREDFRDVLT